MRDVLQVPYFNAPMYLQNKTQIGKVEEIFGCISDGVSRPSFSCISNQNLHMSLTFSLAVVRT